MRPFARLAAALTALFLTGADINIMAAADAPPIPVEFEIRWRARSRCTDICVYPAAAPRPPSFCCMAAVAAGGDSTRVGARSSRPGVMSR